MDKQTVIFIGKCHVITSVFISNLIVILLHIKFIDFISIINKCVIVLSWVYNNGQCPITQYVEEHSGMNDEKEFIKSLGFSKNINVIIEIFYKYIIPMIMLLYLNSRNQFRFSYWIVPMIVVIRTLTFSVEKNGQYNIIPKEIFKVLMIILITEMVSKELQII